MAAFQNLSFETADTGAPGGAADWTMATVSGFFGVAAFGPTIEKGWEDFEAAWNNDVWIVAFVPVDIDAALFEGPTGIFHDYEGFEKGWSNDHLVLNLTLLEEAAFGHGTLPAAPNLETFEGGWLDNELLVLSLGDGADITESFETGWKDNENYKHAFDPADLSAAMFDRPGGVPAAVEAFDGLSLPVAFVADIVNDLLVLDTVLFIISGDQIRFTVERGEPPEPLRTDYDYYIGGIIDPPPNQKIEVCSDAGGVDVIDLTTLGFGVHKVGVTGKRHWTIALED